ncbi:hypothetical protein IS511_11030 [Acinetobacter towneri]|jgi:hypothetical protein|nr:hypothetical protein [Acinetobacter towneri]MBF4521662.1 hypothetical protein [Acinetobacter towneri]
MAKYSQEFKLEVVHHYLPNTEGEIELFEDIESLFSSYSGTLIYRKTICA